MFFPLAVIFYRFGLDRVGWAVPDVIDRGYADVLPDWCLNLIDLTAVRFLVVVMFCIFYEIVSILECIAYQALEGMCPLLNRLSIDHGRKPKIENKFLFKNAPFLVSQCLGEQSQNNYLVTVFEEI